MIVKAVGGAVPSPCYLKIHHHRPQGDAGERFGRHVVEFHRVENKLDFLLYSERRVSQHKSESRASDSFLL